MHIKMKFMMLSVHNSDVQGHAGIVRLLLSRNARVDHTCSQGATALCIAAQEGHAPCVRALLTGGADPAHSDRCGRTALRVAAKSGHEEVVRLLEEAHTSHRSRTGGGSSSISVASTTETKPSSAVLPTYRSASPPAGGSPDSTTDLKRRSYVSVGNQSSSKSSSNFTGSSKSSQGLTLQTTGNADPLLTFTQQLQRASKHRPFVSVKMSTIHSTLKELKIKVIEQVHNYPELYDLTHPKSKDTAHKDEIYDVIGAQLGCPGSDVKFLFNSLRKEYSNQRSVYESKLEQGDPDSVAEPTWAFWKHMYFLRDTMQKRKRVSRSSAVPVTLVGSTLVPILPKPTPSQYIQVAEDNSTNVPISDEKSDKEFGIDVAKYLVIQSSNIENTSMSEQHSASPSGNGFDTSQSSDEDTAPQWHSSSLQVNKDPLEEQMNETPRKKRKLEDSEMTELADAIRSMSSALATNALKMSDVCQHPDICSLE
ncbi:hypothetical protein B566_EDAN004988 [Ephemera danica]|nr:hypothetical protein B566_EDAN004988 [Ephemera danica]